jgi:trimeric autotransporter adhesin
MISRRFRRVTATSFVGLLYLLPGISPVKAQRVPLASRVAALPADAVDLGPMPAAAPVSVRLYVQLDQERLAALDQYLADVQSVGSPNYHHWIKPAEFGVRFGPSAASLAQVRTFAEDEGLQVAGVSASGLRVTLSGTATQMEEAFALGLHTYSVAGSSFVANTAVPMVSKAIAQSVGDIGGLQAGTAQASLMDGFSDAVEANTSAILTLAKASCVEDVSSADQTAIRMAAKQANAQGITVLAATGCEGGAASFPGLLPEVTSVVTTPLNSLASLDPRPQWQSAPGLPADGLRQVPDFTVADISALKQTLLGIAASMPPTADGSAARLGNINATIYGMASIPTVFTQPDGAAPGTWEAATGLGVVNLTALAQFYPRGSFTVNVSGSATNYAPTHGQSTTLMTTVSDISGLGGGVVPTGTVTFATSTGTTLGTVALVNGSASLATSTLPGGSDEVIVSYSGDSNYAAGQGYGIFVSVQGEASAITATVAGSVTLGSNISVLVTDTSASGLGTPTGSVTVAPQGIIGAPTATAPLAGSGGTSKATVTVPATQAGAIVLLVNCVSADLSFTCYSPIRATAIVKQAASTTTFTVSPSTPVTGSTTTFAATVTGLPSPVAAPTGNVGFYDNGALVGSGTLTATGTTTFSTTSLATGTHAFTAVYGGDTNYMASTAAAPGTVPLVATATTLAVSPNPPVNGSTTTLTATVAYTSSGTPATGTVQFYEDAALLGTGTVNTAGAATFSSATITGTTAHSFSASYLGDTVYAASQSTPVTTQANTATVATSTSISASSTTVNTGSMVTLTATLVPTSTIGSAPTGTVSFTSSTQGLLGTATLSGTTASLPVALTMAGMQSITAAYSGDANYKASTSTTPVVVTVGTVITPVTLAVTPATGATYSTPVTAVVSVSGVSTTTGAGPVGSVVFSIASAATTIPITATVALMPSTTTAGVASYTFAAPAPGTYTVTATCTGTNFTCTTTPATASLTTVKGGTVTTVMATPAALVAGQTTTLTATIVAASPLATSSVFTGTVTFYNAGAVAIGMGTVSGNQATLTTSFTSLTGNVITAVYSGDPDWNSSTSAALTLAQALVPTTATLGVNLSSALQGSNIVFTVNIADMPTTAVPNPGIPAGLVTFYDQYNVLSTPLGTATLFASAPNTATAQLSTTGLFHGLHTVTAIYGGNAIFATSTSNVLTVNITDYSVTFTPSTLSLAQGSSGSTTVTIGSLSGFAGTVSLGCTPPPNSLTTCSFSLTAVPAGGVSTLTIGTTASHAIGSQRADLRGLGMGVSLGALLGCVLFPKRRRPALLALIALCGLLGAAGCGQGGSAAIGGTIGGSPLGTQLFTIVTSGSDGISTNRHDIQFQVSIQ